MNQELKEKHGINISCDGCGKVHSVTRTCEIPDSVVSMGCNWCPCCEDKADSYYEEWYNYPDNGEEQMPIPIGDNQLCFPFIIENCITSFSKQGE